MMMMMQGIALGHAWQPSRIGAALDTDSLAGIHLPNLTAKLHSLDELRSSQGGLFQVIRPLPALDSANFMRVSAAVGCGGNMPLTSFQPYAMRANWVWFKLVFFAMAKSFEGGRSASRASDLVQVFQATSSLTTRPAPRLVQPRCT